MLELVVASLVVEPGVPPRFDIVEYDALCLSEFVQDAISFDASGE